MFNIDFWGFRIKAWSQQNYVFQLYSYRVSGTGMIVSWGSWMGIGVKGLCSRFRVIGVGFRVQVF